jgi:SAM-dependent methyltransferase
MRKYRYNQLIQIVKPPSPSLNISHKIISKLIKESGNEAVILDIGCGNRRLAKNVINFDIEKEHNINVVGDGHFLPFKENSFDLIICQAVLEHVIKPQVVVDDIYNTLKCNGIVYAEIPFLQGYHGDPHDYTRFTLKGIRNLFSHFSILNCNVSVGPFSVLSWWLRKIPTILLPNKHLNLGIEFLSGWLTFWIKYFDYIFIYTKNAHIISGGFFIIGKKSELLN